MSAERGPKYRVETDTMGEIRVESDKLWGAQTQRSLLHFRIGDETMPLPLLEALVTVKKAAAQANSALGVLDPAKAEAIERACDGILRDLSEGRREQFPLSVWQTGSGTQTNMNVNEVIAHMTGLHPNDDVNKGQSSNDVFPTAMHMAAAGEVTRFLLPRLARLERTLAELAERCAGIVKIGRTHLQDATPLTLGQEIGAWRAMLAETRRMIESALVPVRKLALGGTAVGTGLNAHPDFGRLATERIGALTGIAYETAENRFHALTSKDALVFLHGALKALAADLMKLANDVRLLASGPRSGIGELVIPENEPGSSIMPGKVNPTQCEALAMVCCQVMGNDVAVGVAASQGHLQLNAYMPVIAHNLLRSVRLLGDAAASFDEHCARGIRPNEAAIKRHLDDSLMLVTCLTPVIGYDKAARIAKAAHENGTALKTEAVGLGFLTEDEFDASVRPERMV
ncbi:MAG: class II fumarate hydratase [Clostridiales Family XIII bacterium]|jgi:fumarate hydratase class II|nr:class II fumarate hydratase [Clostridiales Family XIII bacterium]